MLRMRLSVDCSCVPASTQGGPDNRFAVESPAPFQPHINLIIHRLEVRVAFLTNARPMDTP